MFKRTCLSELKALQGMVLHASCKATVHHAIDEQGVDLLICWLMTVITARTVFLQDKHVLR